MSRSDRHHGPGALLAVIALVLAFGCSSDNAPVRIGFIGGLSGGNADLGQAGRNGAMLAVEQINASGGLKGRPVQLLIRDDGNKKQMAESAARDLVQGDVQAIVGPFTTAMVLAVQSVTEPARVLLISPTASAVEFAGKDDSLLRLGSTSKDYGADYAQFMVSRRDVHEVSMAIDKQNPIFAGSWADGFSRKLLSLGGKVVREIWFEPLTPESEVELARHLLEPKPDAVILVGNAVDAARIIHQLRKLDEQVKIFVSEWAATPQLIELGGRAAEGVEVLHQFNKFSTQRNYLKFVEDYRKRFSEDPTFSGVMAFEATSIILKGLAKRQAGESLKDAILRGGPYDGLQQQIQLDKFGDTRRITYFVTIKDMQYVPAK